MIDSWLTFLNISDFLIVHILKCWNLNYNETNCILIIYDICLKLLKERQLNSNQWNLKIENMQKQFVSFPTKEVGLDICRMFFAYLPGLNYQFSHFNKWYWWFTGHIFETQCSYHLSHRSDKLCMIRYWRLQWSSN